jgi:hypothetical protein
MNPIRLLLVLLLIASPVSAQDHTDIVAAVKANLVAHGVDLSGPCGAFQITGRVAFFLVGENWGLIAKTPGQNGCSVQGHGRYSVDAVMLPDGTVVDMLINSETENIPAWQHAGPQPPSNWRAPFTLDPEIPGPPKNFRIISQLFHHNAVLGLMADVQRAFEDHGKMHHPVGSE